MTDFSFYPVLSDDLFEACGFSCEKYRFSFKDKNGVHELFQKGSASVKLNDTSDTWKIEDDGLTLSKTIHIVFPHLLFGKQGIAPHGSEIGICIIWTNRTLTQTGFILPDSDMMNSEGRTVTFFHAFKAGEIKGDLQLTIALYLKKASDKVLPEEASLINESGVTLGEIESVNLDFKSVFMEFPIEECNSKDQPLWWVEFSQWEDPRVDLFDKENFCLYINTAYDTCPMVGETIKNIDLLIQIISMAYYLIFKKMTDEDLSATKYDIGLQPNSICSIMHQFILNSTDLQWDSDENLLKSLQMNVSAMLKGG